MGQMGSKKVNVGQMVTKKSDHWGSDGFQKRSDHGGQMGYKKVIHVTKRSDHGVRWVTNRSDSVGQMGYNKRTVWVQQVVITQPAAVALKAAGASVGFFSGEY